MKNQSIYLALVITLIASLVACVAPPTPTAPPAKATIKPTIPPISTSKVTASVEHFPTTGTPYPFQGRLVQDNLISKALEGNYMGNLTFRGFLVYLPSDYETSDKRYPVVYVLHGAWMGDSWLVPAVKDAMRKLLEQGEVNEMIFVFPDGTNKLIGSMWMSSAANGDFETYITKELVDKVDSTYRTIPNRDSRAITGCSMGGLGSLHLALKYPNIYGVAVPMNGLQMYKPFIDEYWKQGLSGFSGDYSSWKELAGSEIAFMSSLAMIASPNPNKPPFYFDMPYKKENGKTVIDQVVYDKVKDISVEKDIDSYLAQPTRLNNLYIFTSDEDGEEPWPKIFTDFDSYLTSKGIPHDFTIFSGGHCTYDLSPVIKYLSDHLVFE